MAKGPVKPEALASWAQQCREWADVLDGFVADATHNELAAIKTDAAKAFDRAKTEMERGIYAVARGLSTAKLIAAARQTSTQKRATRRRK